jgi:hypothetical protein
MSLAEGNGALFFFFLLFLLFLCVRAASFVSNGFGGPFRLSIDIGIGLCSDMLESASVDDRCEVTEAIAMS